MKSFPVPTGKNLPLSLVEEGALMRLLDYYFAHEGPIDHDKRYAAARVEADSDKHVVDDVLAKYFIFEAGDNVWVHEWADQTISERNGEHIGGAIVEAPKEEGPTS